MKFSFIVEFISKDKKEIIMIDNYVDINTLNILCKKNQGVDITIAIVGKDSLSAKNITKFNAEYLKLPIKTTTNFYDRF